MGHLLALATTFGFNAEVKTWYAVWLPCDFQCCSNNVSEVMQHFVIKMRCRVVSKNIVQNRYYFSMIHVTCFP